MSGICDTCGDDRFELIAKAKARLLEATNIEMRPDEMAVIDNILFRCWQMGWLDQLRDSGTRYHELFGTPERAADYFATQCFGSDGSMCDYCPYDDCNSNLNNSGSYATVYDALLEWLRGDA